MRVTIIGGGISGLTAAYDLHRGGVEVTLIDAAGRLGGKLYSSPVGDRLVDAGPDTFLARVPDGFDLCKDLGIEGELTSPVAPVPAYLWRDGERRPIPANSVLGVPTDLDALAESGAVSPEGVARAAEDLELPTTTIGDDISVGAYMRARLGDEVTDRLIDPILGGINASDIDRLSLRSGAPQLWDLATNNRSIIEALRKTAEERGATLGSAKDQPVFYGLPGGIARLAEKLLDALAKPNSAGTAATIRTGEAVTSLDAVIADTAADRVIIAVPAGPASALLADVAPVASERLGEIEYASVAQVTVELPKSGVDPILDASGVLFPRVDGRVMTASTWFSTKWAHYDRPDTVLIRMTSGRYGDARALALDDEGLTSLLLNELKQVVTIDQDPVAVRVHRWVDSLPQYVPGHAARVDEIFESVAADAPKVRLIGAAYHGIGIPACIRGARQVAADLLN